MRVGVCIPNEEVTLIFASPSAPRLVVTKITPLAPRTPKTAVADASFNTVTLSISLGSICVNGRSTPSTNINGVESSSERLPIPRINICASSAPGRPEYCTDDTPVIAPARALATLALGDLSNSSVPIELIAPVSVAFFCVP
ncbi:hypothetical protein SDC9_87016 [bioreactor metagenome]|uniref:Uncharacterized protein n=1 Tax=bioreactor metagenome TaxID=1076179 RepID=A0A644ZHP2_9ZZZZ